MEKQEPIVRLVGERTRRFRRAKAVAKEERQLRRGCQPQHQCQPPASESWELQPRAKVGASAAKDTAPLRLQRADQERTGGRDDETA